MKDDIVKTVVGKSFVVYRTEDGRTFAEPKARKKPSMEELAEWLDKLKSNLGKYPINKIRQSLAWLSQQEYE